MKPRRTVSKLLQDTYSRLCATEGGYITPTLYDVWKVTKSGEAVICEAFVSLEKAARSVSQTRRTTFCRYRLDRAAPSLGANQSWITQQFHTPIL